ncbi:hypothetical protein [Aeromonas veronii]|uniref:hypothetical protein n=1 Tax=Aeromonas veronii TaxID=654 RepID=UPI0018EF20C5|nr:hypothetical protein [Aeromonas veronii]
MNLIPGKAHLTAFDILIELRGWLADNTQMQGPLPNCYQLTQADCIEAIDAQLHQLRH